MKNVVLEYARISSRDQNEGRQIEQLKAEGIAVFLVDFVRTHVLEFLLAKHRLL